MAGLVKDRKYNENTRQLSASKKDATFVINKARTGSRPASTNLVMTFEESFVIKETLNRLRSSIMPNHPSLNIIEDLDFYLKNIAERSKLFNTSSLAQIPVNTGIASSSSNSSSLTSSSANSPVQIPSDNVQSPIPAKSSSSSNLFSSSNTNQVPHRILHHSAHFERQPLLNSNSNFKRSSESLFSQVGNLKTIQSNLPNSTRSPNSKSHESTTTIIPRTEPVSIPIINNVKKIVSHFDAQCQNSANNFQRTTKKSEDEKFLNPATILRISKCLQQPQNPTQAPCSSSLLTISSSTSSSTTVSSNHSPSSIPQSSTSSSSSISSNVGNSSNTKCEYYINKHPNPYMITINKS